MITHDYPTPYGDIILTIPEFLRPGDVAINASGGVDSSLLLYMLMSHDVIPTCIFIYNKKILPVKAVAAITPWFENRFNVKLNYIRWERTLDTGHDLVPETRVIARQFKYLYTGVTQNVPVDFPPPAAKPDRPPADSPKIAARGIHMPLLGVDKRAVMYLYRKFELMDLFELTNSCTKVCDVPCGECYHCQERNWALKVTEVL